MPDCKEMYLHLMRETETSIRILIEAQRKCEELHLGAAEPSTPPADPCGASES